MRIFVCELVTGGGLVGEALPPGLCREGGMMLAALVKDLADVPGVNVAITRDHRLPDAGLPAATRRIHVGDDPWSVWREEIETADAVWPIAPETGGLLERLTGMILDSGRTLLGCRPEAVRLTTSKLSTSAHLAAHGIRVAPTKPLLAALHDGLPASDTGWVVKPDDGAGAEDTTLWRSDRGLYDWAAEHAPGGRYVVQPFVAGAAGSLSLLCCEGRAALLTCNSQDVSVAADRFRYLGGIVGGRERDRAELAPLAEAVAAAVPGLWGYVGVDFIAGASGPVVLEINPRLTTSYAGLGAAIGLNPAALVLQLLDGTMPMFAPPASIVPKSVRTDALAEAEVAR